MADETDQKMLDPNDTQNGDCAITMNDVGKNLIDENSNKISSHEENKSNDCISTIWNKKILPSLSFLSIAISIISLTVMIVEISETTSDMSNSPRYCVPCKTFDSCISEKQKNLLSQLNTFKDENKAESCCALNNSQLFALGQLIKEYNYGLCYPIELPPVENPTNFSMSKNSMHMKLEPSEEYDDNIKYPKFQEYNLYFNKHEHIPLLEHNRNMEIFDSGVKITKSGLYFIYCSVFFKPDSAEECGTFQENVWHVTLKRTRSGDNTFSGPLLTITYTCCKKCVKIQETGYTAGAFALKTNDFLSIDVNGDGLVSYKPQSTFFGMFFIGPTDDD